MSLKQQLNEVDVKWNSRVLVLTGWLEIYETGFGLQWGIAVSNLSVCTIMRI